MSVCCSYLSLLFPYIANVKYPHRRTEGTNQKQDNSKNQNGKDCVTFHRTTAYHCCHSSHAFTGSCEKFLFPTYDSLSALPWKYEPGQNRIRTFLKTPVVFSGFSLLILKRTSLAVFAGVQDVVHLVFKWAQHFLFTISFCQAAPYRVSHFLSMSWARKAQISEKYYLYFLASKIFF